MSHRILLVDDEVDILEFVRYNLVREGYEVFTAENGGIGQETATAGAPACGGQLPAEESTKEAADRTRHAGPQEAGSAEGIRTAAVQGEVSEDLRNAASAGEKSGGQDACVTDTADKTSDGKEGAR